MNDLLSDRLHGATQDLAARLRSGSAVRAVATRRRQRRRVLAGGVAAVAVAVVATTVQVENDADRLLPAVNRSTSPAPSTSPTAEPTPAPSSAPSPVPSVSSIPSPTPRSSPTAAPTSGNPLAGFHFQEEATWKPIPNEVTVTRSDDLRTAWALDPCTPTAYPTDRQRVAMASLVMSGPEAGDVRQLAVYPDAATAAEVMAGFRRVLAACASPAGSTGKYVTAPISVADEGLVVAQSIYYQSGTQVPGGGYYVLVRDGRSVYLAVIGREFLPKGPTDAAATELVAAARGQLPLPQ